MSHRQSDAAWSTGRFMCIGQVREAQDGLPEHWELAQLSATPELVDHYTRLVSFDRGARGLLIGSRCTRLAHLIAMHAISTRASRGSRATCTVARAGGWSLKKVA